jgi:hypothetical protein
MPLYSKKTSNLELYKSTDPNLSKSKEVLVSNPDAPLQTVFPNKEAVISKTPQNNFQSKTIFSNIFHKTIFKRFDMSFSHKYKTRPSPGVEVRPR